MLEIRFKTLDEAGPGHGRALARAVEVALANGHVEEAYRIIVESISFGPILGWQHDHMKAAAQYYLGLLYAWLGDGEKSIGAVVDSGVSPNGSWDPLPFLEQYLMSAVTRDHKMRAQERGVPTVLLTALPKSASAFVSQSLGGILDAPLLRTGLPSADPAHRHIVVPTWLQFAASGGCVTHEHFAASQINLRSMRAADIGQIFVQLRDPRAAAWSYYHHVRRNNQFVADPEALFIDEVARMSQWIESWLDAAEEERDWLSVDFVQFDDVRSNPNAVFTSMLSTLGVTDAAGLVDERVAPVGAEKNTLPNYRTGTSDEWRGQVRKSAADKAWARIPQRARSILKLDQQIDRRHTPRGEISKRVNAAGL